MLTFLRITVVAVPLAVLIAMIGASPAQAASTVILRLHPSPDDPTYSGYVPLGCGWHWDCTYPEPDDPMYGALDFWKNPCCDYDGEQVLWRMQGRRYDVPGTTTVGRITRTDGYQGPGCDYVTGEMYKLDGTFLARAMYYHTRPGTIGYTRYIYANSDGYQNVNTWGWMSTENPADCGVTAPCCHVHQDSQINVGVTLNWGRGGYPDKAHCFQCGSLYTIWIWYQMWFSYYL